MKKYLFLILMFVSFCFACGGSCIPCHSKLEPIIDDKDHRVLSKCISCHDKPLEQGQCGADCFDCHKKEKLYSDASVKEHQAISACFECHRERFELSPIEKKSLPSNQIKPLVDLLK